MKNTNKDETSQVKSLLEIINEQQQVIDNLKDEILKLRKETIKPKIKPSRLNNKNKDADDKDKQKRNSTKGIAKKEKKIEIHERKEIELDNIPKGAKFIGYKKIEVQDLMIKAHNTEYRLKQYITEDGKYITAKLPDNTRILHYGKELCTFILYQYHHQHVTQPLLMDQLRDLGIEISSGQLSNIITKNLEEFHQEKDEILEAGLENAKYIQTDDTGARHDGINGYCTQIGNEFFTWFESTQTKSRINFLQLLGKGVKKPLYVLNSVSLEYMERQKLPSIHFSKLKDTNISIDNKEDFDKWLETEKILTKNNIKIVTEAALIGGLVAQGIPSNLSVLSDGARQFNIFDHALCWVHAERSVNRLIPLNEEYKKLVESARGEIWDIYQNLKEYKLNPAPSLRQTINNDFNKFANKITGYKALDKAVDFFKNNRGDLLKVLDKPYLPLHNNLSERDIRDYVKKRKISGSTRSEDGRKARDSFASLKKTCKKLNISFLDYLKDRLSGNRVIACLGDQVRSATCRSG